MVIVKVELSEKEKYENCNIEFAGTEIVGVVCENTVKRKAMISLIAGYDQTLGNCMLNDISMQYTPQAYKKMVDYIDLNRVDSTLTVKNYLTFYAMVAGVYSSDTIVDATNVLVAMGMQQLSNVRINDLEKADKIIVRCIAAYLKQIKCLVSDNILEGLDKEQRDKVLRFLNEYFIKKQCVCLLFESRKKTLDKIAAKIVRI